MKEVGGNMPNAPISKRVLASMIDYAIIFGLTYVFALYFGEPNSNGGYTVQGLKFWVVSLLWFLYFVVAEAEFGQTLGHACFGMRVIRLDNKPLRLGDTFKRHLVDPIDLFPFGIPALITAGNNPNGQRIGDQVAGTKVIPED
jgi:uncharacterized RDD family membrane protein YckC